MIQSSIPQTQERVTSSLTEARVRERHDNRLVTPLEGVWEGVSETGIADGFNNPSTNIDYCLFLSIYCKMLVRYFINHKGVNSR